MSLYPSLSAAAAALASGQTSSLALVEALLARIQATEEKIGAYAFIDAARSRAAAQASDARRAAGQALSPYDGIPIATKDNIALVDEELRCGSNILDGLQSLYSATVHERLLAQGIVLLGRANMDEFAMGSTTANSRIKKTLNPHALDRVPGGSSGGSAAGVAAGSMLAALGSDTGGSIRQPASFCGVVGLKPTYGRVSRFGLVAYASSLDQIGPIGRSVADVAIIYDMIAGHDPKDSTSIPGPVEPVAPSLAQASLQGLRIGVPDEYMNCEGLCPEVRAAVDAALQRLRELGASTVPVKLASTAHSIPAYYCIATAEASTNLARFDAMRYGRRVIEKPASSDEAEILRCYKDSRGSGFGPEVQRRILLGTFMLSKGYSERYYLKAQKVRTLISRDFATAFTQCDIIAGPVAPTAAFAFGEKKTAVQTWLEDVLTVGVNLAGLPALSIPCGATKAKLPVGLQLIGPALSEKRLLQAAHAFETLSGIQLPQAVL